jgi:hypothetical protein
MTAPAPQCQPTTEHAPTPWRVNGNAIWSDVGYVAELSCPRGPDARDADAAFIVTAVNSHATLTDRVEELEKALQPFADYQLTVVGFANVTSLKSDLDGCNWVAGFSGPTQPEFRHFGNARAVLEPKGAV